MKPTSISLLTLPCLVLLFATKAVGQLETPKPHNPLPFVQTFDPTRYLGTWYEVARLPTRIQPPETLAMAEYSPGKSDGHISVKNTAFDVAGRKLSEIHGQAKLAEGDPPGRLLVAFGPAFPDAPNYHVLHVDQDYQYAVVGVPDRQSLWILARKVPVPDKAFRRLRDLAQEAGFEVVKLIVAPWSNIEKIPGAAQDSAVKP